MQGMLNGWKAIAAYLRRDERTAMRWATERGMPVHRSPGPGRGSIYALTGEIDAWLAADRERAVDTVHAPAPVVITPAVPAVVTLSAIPRWRQRSTVATTLTGVGALMVVLGAVTLHRPAATGTAPEPVYTDPAARAMFLQASYDWNQRTRDSLDRARREYSEAIGRDPRVPPLTSAWRTAICSCANTARCPRRPPICALKPLRALRSRCRRDRPRRSERSPLSPFGGGGTMRTRAAPSPVP